MYKRQVLGVFGIDLIKKPTILTSLSIFERALKCYCCCFNIQLSANVFVYALHIYVFERARERKMEREKERKIIRLPFPSSIQTKALGI